MTIADGLRSALPHLILEESVPLSQYTYMRTGGPAEVLVTVKEQEDLVSLLEYLTAHGLEFRILGGGSNVLVPDDGLSGVTILNRVDHFVASTELNHRRIVRVGSGHLTSLFVRKTMDLELTGTEPFLGVPGTIGGAVYNNSHYMNKLLSDILSSVEVYRPHHGIVHYKTEDLHFKYDYSDLQKTHEVVLVAEFELAVGDPAEIRDRMLMATQKRASTQPIGVPSSGCMFKNVELPDGRMLSTGQLIDEAGLKGFSIDGAEVSTVHANFLVNKGTATTSSILALAEQIEETIFKRTGHRLEREVFVLK